MALGGGTFLVQNKVLPGSYINFISLAKASASLSDRGYVAMPIEMDWGVDGDVFTVTPEDLQKDSVQIFGYSYTDEKLKGMRDLFCGGLKAAYLYRLNSGEKAQNDIAVARHSGICGNNITIIVAANVDEPSKYDVKTLYGSKGVDLQTVAKADELTDNDYVSWKSGATLEETAGVKLIGGTNKDGVTGDDYQTFLDKIESYSFNTLGCLSTEKTVCGLFTAFTKRMRDEVGAKFQTVLYRTYADYEGIISVENKTADKDWPESAAVYWVTGTEAGCPVGGERSTLTNRKYNGEFTIDTDYKQSQLEAALKAGKFMFHKVGDKVAVLDDINSFITVTVEKNEDFCSNQTIRVLDQIGNDIAVLFNGKYLGNVPNDDAGRISFWADIVKHHKELQKIRAIEGFTEADVKVGKGDKKKSVVVTDSVTPVNCMAQLYMTVIVA